MELHRSDKIWTLAGLFLLVGVFVYSLTEGYKIRRDDSNSLVNITLKANIANAHEVKIAGSFNNWQARCCLEKSAASDEWSIQLQLLPGVYEYVFIVDGEHWLPSRQDGKLKDGLGGRNAVLYVNKTLVKQGGGNV